MDTFLETLQEGGNPLRGLPDHRLPAARITEACIWRLWRLRAGDGVLAGPFSAFTPFLLLYESPLGSEVEPPPCMTLLTPQYLQGP